MYAIDISGIYRDLHPHQPSEYSDIIYSSLVMALHEEESGRGEAEKGTAERD